MPYSIPILHFWEKIGILLHKCCIFISNMPHNHFIYEERWLWWRLNDTDFVFQNLLKSLIFLNISQFYFPFFLNTRYLEPEILLRETLRPGKLWGEGCGGRLERDQDLHHGFWLGAGEDWDWDWPWTPRWAVIGWERFTWPHLPLWLVQCNPIPVPIQTDFAKKKQTKPTDRK